MKFFRWLLVRWEVRMGGATTTEYALVLALVVIVLIGTLQSLGTVLTAKLQAITDSLSQAKTGP